jgi:thiol-disulfide isomerase/thioredoxin
MNRWRRCLILAGAAAALAPRAHAQAPRSSGGGGVALPRTGQDWPLPESVQLLDGTLLRPVREPGKVLVLYWWASWCPFCALQGPMLDKLYRAQRDRGLQMLGLSIDKKREDAQAYMKAKGFAFASTWVTADIERVMPRPKGLPATVVIGRDGKVATSLPGQSFPEDIEDIALFL